MAGRDHESDPLRMHAPGIAVVIPCHRVRDQILGVIASIGPSVSRIFVVDDKCPQQSGAFVEASSADPRVRVLYHEVNQGVGGATLTGYRAALVEGWDIVVKIDGDGQMDPANIDLLVAPIVRGVADYAKGNRFYSPGHLASMPWIRLFGNSALSFINKLVSGYWIVMDPTNGYTAIGRTALQALPLDALERRYFFESDMLFRLGLVRAVVRDVPMPASYGDEESGLRIGRVLMEFPQKYLVRFLKRIAYLYFIRDFNAGTVFVLAAAILFTFSAIFGGYHWWASVHYGIPATAGTVMVAAMPVILGFQLLIGAANFDVTNVPTQPLQPPLAPGIAVPTAVRKTRLS